MKPIILARLRPFIDSFGSRATFRVLGRGRRWALVFIHADDNADPAAWRRKAGQ